MTGMTPAHPGRALPWLALAALVAVGPAARAQDLDDEPEDPPVQLQRNLIQRNRNELPESNFDQWVFGNVGNSVSAQDRLQSLLTLSIEEVERACSLTEAQKKKLLLAGHGDLKRFMDRIAEARKVFFRLRADQTNIHQIFQETQPLAASLRLGLFGEDSMFAKTLRSTLNPEQSARYREALRDKVRFRYRARVNLAVANLDAAVGFTADQRRRLIELTLDETTAPSRPAGTYETNIVLIKISRLPESKVRSILDDESYRLLNRRLQQARGMEGFLKARGYLDEDPPARLAKPAEAKND